MKPTPDVIIDSCIPRTPFERAERMFDYLVSISEVGPHAALDPENIRINMGTGHDVEWSEVEDRIINTINDKLPDCLICTCGEFQSGDVIVREMNHENEVEG